VVAGVGVGVEGAAVKDGVVDGSSPLEAATLSSVELD
jgi:hypothetical protein